MYRTYKYIKIYVVYESFINYLSIFNKKKNIYMFICVKLHKNIEFLILNRTHTHTHTRFLKFFTLVYIYFFCGCINIYLLEIHMLKDRVHFLYIVHIENEIFGFFS